MTKLYNFTILSGQTTSDRLTMTTTGLTAITRLMSILTDANCPSANLTLSVIDTIAGETVVKSVPNFSLAVAANSAYGAQDCSTLASLVDGLEWELVLDSAPSSNTVIQVRLT